MHRGIKNNEVPVLFQIRNLDDRGFYYFKLDSEEYSIFPGEKEVLLSSGIKFNI